MIIIILPAGPSTVPPVSKLAAKARSAPQTEGIVPVPRGHGQTREIRDNRLAISGT